MSYRDVRHARPGWRGLVLWRRDLQVTDDYSAGLDNNVCCLNVAEEPRRRPQHDGVAALNVRDQFARNVRAIQTERVRPAKALPGGNNELARLEAAFELGGGINLQRIFGCELPEDASFEDEVCRRGIRI